MYINVYRLVSHYGNTRDAAFWATDPTEVTSPRAPDQLVSPWDLLLVNHYDKTEFTVYCYVYNKTLYIYISLFRYTSIFYISLTCIDVVCRAAVRKAPQTRVTPKNIRTYWKYVSLYTSTSLMNWAAELVTSTRLLDHNARNCIFSYRFAFMW